MKHIALITLLIFSANTFAASAKLQGFIGLGLLDYSKISNEDATSGIGFDKFTATITGKREAFAAKIKLNLDLSDDAINGDKFYLFDEVNVAYNYEDMLYVTVGKGLLPFQSFHYGAVRPYSVDGGSLYDHTNFRPAHFRNDDPALLTSVKFVPEDLNLTYELTFFGREHDVNIDRDYESNDKTFKIENQRGLTEKLTWTPSENYKFVASGYWHKMDAAPSASYAGHLYHEYKGEEWNIWTGYLYGQYYAHDESNDAQKNDYHVAESQEHIGQVGAEYDFTELVNLYTNLEYYYTVDTEYQTDGSGNWLSNRDGEKTTHSIRLELGAKFKMAKNAFVNVGAIHERNSIKFSGAIDSDKERYSGHATGDTLKSNATAGLATLSYWF